MPLTKIQWERRTAELRGVLLDSERRGAPRAASIERHLDETRSMYALAQLEPDVADALWDGFAGRVNATADALLRNPDRRVFDELGENPYIPIRDRIKVSDVLDGCESLGDLSVAEFDFLIDATSDRKRWPSTSWCGWDGLQVLPSCLGREVRLWTLCLAGHETVGTCTRHRVARLTKSAGEWTVHHLDTRHTPFI